MALQQTIGNADLFIEVQLKRIYFLKSANACAEASVAASSDKITLWHVNL